jgi:predicted cupin superfamily sugar epimerase
MLTKKKKKKRSQPVFTVRPYILRRLSKSRPALTMLPRLGLIFLLLGVEALADTLTQPNPFSWALSSASQNHTAQEVIDQLGLSPSTEKGYYFETFRDPATNGNRSVSTAIYYLLEGAVGKSYWHRIDAAEVWHYYAGAPLSLFLSFDDGQPVREVLMGPDIFHEQSPQVVIMTREWQQALSHGEWTLVGTTGKSSLSSNEPSSVC